MGIEEQTDNGYRGTEEQLVQRNSGYRVVRGKMANNLLEYANGIIISISVFIRSTKENIT